MPLITIVNFAWLAFMLYWAVSALSAKRSTQGPRWGREIGIRFVIFLVMIGLIRAMRAGHLTYVIAAVMSMLANPVLHIVGLILFAAGLGLAIWARLYLGRNWGVPMSLRQGHELVTSGPYRFVRHPIYAGFLLAVVGSILVGEFWWLPVLPVIFIYFVYSAVTEERMMTEQFPGEYPEYRNRTKMLIPSLF